MLQTMYSEYSVDRRLHKNNWYPDVNNRVQMMRQTIWSYCLFPDCIAIKICNI